LDPSTDPLALALRQLNAGVELTRTERLDCFRELSEGRFDPVLAAGFLAALRFRGESSADLAAAVEVMRSVMLPLAGGDGPLLDTCGTGGDGSGSFNISTATALVVAAAGVRVVKHGNRAISGKTGSADVLRELGIPIEAGPEWAAGCLEAYGFAFCYAPQFHPALANLADLRRRLGIPTVFNLLGPLLNPAGAGYQLLGAGSRSRQILLAQTLARLHTDRAMIVHSNLGEYPFDEITLTGPTSAMTVERDTIIESTIHPEDFGLPTRDSKDVLDAVRVSSAMDSAALIRRILAGGGGIAADIVLVNAAAAFRVIGRVEGFPEGVALARETLASGKVSDLVENLRRSDR